MPLVKATKPLFFKAQMLLSKLNLHIPFRQHKTDQATYSTHSLQFKMLYHSSAVSFQCSPPWKGPTGFKITPMASYFHIIENLLSVFSWKDFSWLLVCFFGLVIQMLHGKKCEKKMQPKHNTCRLKSSTKLQKSKLENSAKSNIICLLFLSNTIFHSFAGHICIYINIYICTYTKTEQYTDACEPNPTNLKAHLSVGRSWIQSALHWRFFK